MSTNITELGGRGLTVNPAKPQQARLARRRW